MHSGIDLRVAGSSARGTSVTDSPAADEDKDWLFIGVDVKIGVEDRSARAVSETNLPLAVENEDWIPVGVGMGVSKEVYLPVLHVLDTPSLFSIQIVVCIFLSA